MSYENANNIVRGSYESIQTAKMFGEFYNQPGSITAISMPLAMAAEAFGTFLWMFGWGSAAFPDKSGGFIFVYVIAPIIGGQAGGLLFTKVLETAKIT